MAASFDVIVKYVEWRARELKMQAYPFKVNDYNTQVVDNFPQGKGKEMMLNYPAGTIAFEFIFDSTVISWNDIGKVMNQMVDDMKKEFPEMEQDFYDPNKINTSTKLPYVHVQTAGNAAGGAFYYQESQVTDPPKYWKGKTIYGSSVNLDYRLSTAFAGTVVFATLKQCEFVPPPPVDVYRTQAEKIMLLNHNYMVFFKKCPLDCPSGKEDEPKEDHH